MDILLNRTCGDPVHHLHSSGNNARPDYIGHCITGLADIIKSSHDNLGLLCTGDELDDNLGHDAEHPLTAGHEREQIITRGVQTRAPDLEDLPRQGDYT